MADYNQYPSHGYAPSAPPMPEPSSGHKPSSSGQPSAPSGYPYHAPPSSYGYSSPYTLGAGGGGAAGYYFPPGTHPEIIRSFQAVDRDRSGFIDEYELQAALSSGYQKFSLRTIRLLMFLFQNPNNPSKMGPAEFAALWNCIGQWQGIFDRFDRDRSGKIDSMELRDALLSLGYAVPPSVIQVLISNYTDGKTGKGALNFDNFVESGMIVKGLTEKFKEKDTRYTGSATLTYDTFMSMVIPFIVP
ncbi:probable calcium-binding protein CML48 [Elaeis guineensis]|uniref:Probable calcium-binding protein CML48 n=1 Tax=Elaeis guineensis var. tenera TaxID=51953 RepID=A0A6I9QCI8_ELAGV|nr:probable calcium-binding protein CML48 [Elaeis guineensis]XP_010906965.1 probable calcium-binding protein CML48 [Elaeis guineensis]XP_010906966.1 probable calcium-binding protein CML48 [Elaeis guineensis]